MSQRLLIVEDDRAMRSALADAFQQEGYEIETAADGRAAAELVFSRHFDLVLLDVMLPGKSGFEILREMREAGLETAVLVLTVRSDVDDRVLGLDLGADDYVTKPFELRELIARVRALLRRGTKARGSGPMRPLHFHVGEVDVDLGTFELVCAGVTYRLSRTEADILALLHAEAGRVVSRDRFLDEVWGRDSLVGHRTIDTHVLNLRQKLEQNPAQPRHLITVHGVGYRLVL
ncbi:MAG: response regulator transcription factor [Planctomycetota bacterium]